jgi:hypothetical protein
MSQKVRVIAELGNACLSPKLGALRYWKSIICGKKNVNSYVMHLINSYVTYVMHLINL